MDTFFSKNFSLLRKTLPHSPTQDTLALEMGIKRTTIAAYEGGRTMPRYNELVRIADFFKVNVDDLLRKDLSQTPIKSTTPKEDNLRVLVTTIDSHNRENIEFVPIKAVAGYASGYGDMDYISRLPVFQVPFLPKDRKYRVFPIQGDSMPPLREGTLVFAEYIEDWQTIKSGTVCVVVTNDEGVVLKKVFNYLEEKNVLVLKSTNERYAPYPVMGQDIKELWKFVGYFDAEFPLS